MSRTIHPEQRQFPRAPFNGSIALCRERTPRVVQSENIGAGGVLLSADEVLPARSLVTLRINMADGGGFTVMGRVVRSHAMRGSMAVEFVDILPMQRARLDAYVASRSGHARQAS